MIKTLIEAIFAFAATNIDDILLLTVLFAGAYHQKEKIAVIVGQYIGIFVLFAISIFGALGAKILPTESVGLLGFVPITLGIRALFLHREDDTTEKKCVGIFGMALLTVANGADNIGVYIPLFSGFEMLDFVLTACVFAVMTGLWCVLGLFVGAFPLIKDKIGKFKRILVPLVLIALGAWILIENYLL